LLKGFVPWPPEFARRYTDAGLWEGITVAEMVERSARRHPQKVAIVYGDVRITYDDLIRSATRVARGLLGLGLRAQDRVVVQLPNCPEFVSLYLALNYIGVIPVMALRPHRQTEVRHFVASSEAVAYVIADRVGSFDYRPMAAAIAAEHPFLRHVIVVGEPAPNQTPFETLASGDTDQSGLDDRRPDAGDVSTMLLSGGTTALSKLIPRTHNDYVYNARVCSEVAGFSADTVFLAMLPLGHNYNLACPGMLGTFYAGGTLVIARSTEVNEVFTAVARERVTDIAAVVPLVTTWLNGNIAQQFDVSSLRVIENGGARLPPELRFRLRKEFGCVPQEIYGTAEGLINMTRLTDPDEFLLESSGAPVSEFDEIDVVDLSGEPVADGESGELITRGPYTIRGYYNADQINAEAFTADGFYRMGDIVRKRGRYVYTEGRRKDLINRGGEKINCEEIENLIFRLRQVQAVSVVAMADPVFGEKACACVVLAAGTELTFDQLISHLRAQQIASFKLPERLEVLDSFPVSPAGKILKRELREIVARRIAADAQRGGHGRETMSDDV
jgi:2,3-dihydroxybenzoate---[aryl-carrier protein] ligase